jgi:hypothetical protein
LLSCAEERRAGQHCKPTLAICVDFADLSLSYSTGRSRLAIIDVSVAALQLMSDLPAVAAGQ